MSDLVEFLLARIKEREDTAMACLNTGARANLRRGIRPSRWEFFNDGRTGAIRSTDGIARDKGTWPAEGKHMALNDPAYVLADCATKRRIVERYLHHAYAAAEFKAAGNPQRSVENIRDALFTVLLDLIIPFVKHRDYNPEWRPIDPYETDLS